MFLEQICPGQANSYPHALHTFSFEQDRFVIYATGSKIVIYADPNKLIQTVVAENLFALSKETESITSVAGNSATGQIALSYHSQVAILKPEKDKEQIKWHLESVLETSFTVNCLDWSVHNILLVAGIDIVLWKYDQDTSNWMIQYQTKPANEIMFAKFEPKTDMFATIGKAGHYLVSSFSY
ncbi:hypothetical protein BD560DRAFT_121555 [Blakeslea trispora]|nr:hypothetical protein BD560DRAFT_121555 [Blakeslea trispora]